MTEGRPDRVGSHGENTVRGRPEGDAAGELGQIRKSDGGAQTPVGKAGYVVSEPHVGRRRASFMCCWIKATQFGG